MVRVYGYYYYEDGRRGTAVHQFENIGQFLAQVKKHSSPEEIRFPAHHDD
jgi:hypothetical protein